MVRMKSPEVPESSPALVQRTKGVDSARRVLQILLQFSDGRPELTIDDMLETHEISVPSAYRYLALLREMNLIEERGKGVFVLTPQILRLARAAEISLDHRTEVQPILDRLSTETGETALYLRQVNDAAVCLAIAESDHPISISFQPGHLMPLHGGAAAKILFAEFSDAKRNQYFERLTPPLGRAQRAALVESLEEIKRTGYAESVAEVDAGVWAVAAAVRLHGALIGAITVVAPEYRLDDEQKERIRTAVGVAADDFVTLLRR